MGKDKSNEKRKGNHFTTVTVPMWVCVSCNTLASFTCLVLIRVYT